MCENPKIDLFKLSFSYKILSVKKKKKKKKTNTTLIPIFPIYESKRLNKLAHPSKRMALKHEKKVPRSYLLYECIRLNKLTHPSKQFTVAYDCLNPAYRYEHGTIFARFRFYRKGSI